MRLYRHQLEVEQRLFWRSRESAVFVFLFRCLLFTLLTAVYNGRIDGRPASWALLAGHDRLRRGEHVRSPGLR